MAAADSAEDSETAVAEEEGSATGAGSGVAVAAVEAERGIRRAGASTTEGEVFAAVVRGTETLSLCCCDLSCWFST